MTRKLYKPVLNIQGKEILIPSELALTGMSTAEIIANAYNATADKDDKLDPKFIHDRPTLLCVAWYSKLDN